MKINIVRVEQRQSTATKSGWQAVFERFFKLTSQRPDLNTIEKLYNNLVRSNQRKNISFAQFPIERYRDYLKFREFGTKTSLKRYWKKMGAYFSMVAHLFERLEYDIYSI